MAAGEIAEIAETAEVAEIAEIAEIAEVVEVGATAIGEIAAVTIDAESAQDHFTPPSRRMRPLKPRELWPKASSSRLWPRKHSTSSWAYSIAWNSASKWSPMRIS
jgi:hypothetical protein